MLSDPAGVFRADIIETGLLGVAAYLLRGDQMTLWL
jgi:hypothetical protein